MKLHRIQVKSFVRNPSRIDLSALIPVFHKWIQNDALEEMLIDVANYEHVVEGPGILLIAHEADFALDLSRGRPGLLYTRKRDLPANIGDALKMALRRLFNAARLLEEDESLGGSYRFRTDELEIRFPDRLRVPNRAESLALVQDDVLGALEEFYGVTKIDIAWTGDDARLPFSVHVLFDETPSVAELADRPAETQS